MSDELQHIRFEGNDVCIIAPEDYVALRAENERLRREVEVLRQYGNKDCTRMADAAIRARAGDQPGT